MTKNKKTGFLSRLWNRKTQFVIALLAACAVSFAISKLYNSYYLDPRYQIDNPHTTQTVNTIIYLQNCLITLFAFGIPMFLATYYLFITFDRKNDLKRLIIPRLTNLLIFIAWIAVVAFSYNYFFTHTVSGGPVFKSYPFPVQQGLAKWKSIDGPVAGDWGAPIKWGYGLNIYFWLASYIIIVLRPEQHEIDDFEEKEEDVYSDDYDEDDEKLD